MDEIEKEQLLNNTIATLKASIVSKSGTVFLKDIDDEYQRFAEKSIPYLKLGYPNIQQFIRSIPGVKMLVNSKGETLLTVTDSQVSHIAQLVKNQKATNRKHRNISIRKKQNNVSKDFDHINRTADHRRFKRISHKSLYMRRRNQQRYNYSEEEGYHSNSSGDEGCKTTGNYVRTPNIRIDANRKMNKTICEPIAYYHQLIGDDFFLQLAIRELHANNLWKADEKSAIQSGLCISGQTIADCLKNLHKVNTVSSRIVILLGAVDIYKGTPVTEMTKNMEELLHLLEKKFLLSKSAITICTIPPLANIPFLSNIDKLTNLYSFNNFIRKFAAEAHYGFIDIFNHFTYEDAGGQICTDYDLFQTDARMVSGCRYPHVLWNQKGRTLAMKLLRIHSKQGNNGYNCDYYY